MDKNLYSLDLEYGLVGAALINPFVMDDAEQIYASDFHDIQLGHVWKLLGQMSEDGEGIDILTVSEKLERTRDDSPSGGWFGRLTEITNKVATTGTAGTMAAEIKKLALARDIRELATKQVQGLYTGGDPLAAIGRYSRELEALAAGQPVGDSVWTAAELGALVWPDAPWQLENVLLNEGITLLGGDIGGGKTWLALDLSLACATGGSAWEQTFPKAGNVLYLGIDNPQRTLTNRLKLLAAGKRVELPQNFIVDGTPYNLAKPEGMDAVRHMIRQHGITLVVVDALAAYMGGADENAAADMASVFVNMRRAANESAGLSWLIVHHLRKGGGLKGALIDLMERIRGSSAIPAGVDCAFALTMRGDGDNRERRLAQVKNREGEELPPRNFAIRSTATEATLDWGFASKVNLREDEYLAAALDILRASDKAWSGKELGEQLAAKGKPLGERRFKYLCSDLKDTRGVRYWKEGRTGFYQWTNQPSQIGARIGAPP